MLFTKMQGLGNDYIYLNCLSDTPENPSALAIRLADRHYGIGGDGLICICASQVADFRMEMYNADGSRGAMCGNGIRCLAKYLYDHGLTPKHQLVVETDAGLRFVLLHIEHNTVSQVTVDMDAPQYEPKFSLTIDDEVFTIFPVSMGNPHAVIFTSKIDRIALSNVGPMIENHPSFPNKTNVEFVEVLDQNSFQMRVWERGSGETLACGTGACAAFASAFSQKTMKAHAVAHLLGGDLHLHMREDGHITMTGPAVTVFEGNWISS
jgi:diaminopimelate epimerase